jgi:hypothetical protein
VRWRGWNAEVSEQAASSSQSRAGKSNTLRIKASAVRSGLDKVLVPQTKRVGNEKEENQSGAIYLLGRR